MSEFSLHSARVKALSFHAERPWILVGLHDGKLEIWDYQNQTLQERYANEHQGAVRAVCFHPHQPLFASGGDDTKVRLWSYAQRRITATLVGHLDYVRCVSFHTEQPWLLSGSDDQVLRLWNWQSRTCLGVLAGHNHYVMCGVFHPSGQSPDLVASGSLDQTIRIWDITGVRTRKPAPSLSELARSAGVLSDGTDSYGSDSRSLPAALPLLAPDLFANEIFVRCILEGHERAVNSVAFHPTRPLLVSGSDDKTIRVWSIDEACSTTMMYNETAPFPGYELEQLRGHTGNVTCVLLDVETSNILSASEDGTIRMWNTENGNAIKTISRPGGLHAGQVGRIWSLAVNENGLIAFGYDHGFGVTRLRSEHPAYSRGVHFNAEPGHVAGLYYVREGTLYTYNFDTRKESIICSLRRKGIPNHLYYVENVEAALCIFDETSPRYELYTIGSKTPTQRAAVEMRKGYYSSTAFCGSGRIIALDQSNLLIKNLQNETVSSMPLTEIKRGESFHGEIDPASTVLNGGLTEIHTLYTLSGSENNVLASTPTHILLLEVDLNGKASVISCRDSVKDLVGVHSQDDYAYTSEDNTVQLRSVIVLVAKNELIVCDSTRLGTLFKVKELHREITSCVFGNVSRQKHRTSQLSSLPLTNAIFFATTAHLKFVLSNGHVGTVREISSKKKLYLAAVFEKTAFFITDASSVCPLEIDLTELHLKQALSFHEHAAVNEILRGKKVHGQALAAYLLSKKNLRPMAEYFVRDSRSKFFLSLEKGKLNEARKYAKELDTSDIWQHFSRAAWEHGDALSALEAYESTNDENSQAETHLLLGNLESLETLVEKSTCPHLTTTYSMILGNHTKQLDVLVQSGQYALALALARTRHMGSDIIQELEEKFKNRVQCIYDSRDNDKGADNECEAQLCLDNLIQRCANLETQKQPSGLFSMQDSSLEFAELRKIAVWPHLEDETENVDEFYQHDLVKDFPEKTTSETFSDSYKNPTRTKERVLDNEMHFTDHSSLRSPSTRTASEAWDLELDMEEKQTDQFDQWDAMSDYEFDKNQGRDDMPIYAMLTGDGDRAMHLLLEQCGICHFDCILPYMGKLRDVEGPLGNASFDDLTKRLPITREFIDFQLNEAMKLTTEGKFLDASQTFHKVLCTYPTIVVPSSEEAQEIESKVFLPAVSYIQALNTELYRRKHLATHPGDIPTSLKLALYFTHFDLQQEHLILALRSAMVLCYKAGNFGLATNVAARLLEFSLPPAVEQQACKLISTQKLDNAHQVEYDPTNMFTVCSASHCEIKSSEKDSVVWCKYCVSPALVRFEGELCEVCRMSKYNRKLFTRNLHNVW